MHAVTTVVTSCIWLPCCVHKTLFLQSLTISGSCTFPTPFIKNLKPCGISTLSLFICSSTFVLIKFRLSYLFYSLSAFSSLQKKSNEWLQMLTYALFFTNAILSFLFKFIVIKSFIKLNVYLPTCIHSGKYSVNFFFLFLTIRLFF